jgi:hypothetical protein
MKSLTIPFFVDQPRLNHVYNPSKKTWCEICLDSILQEIQQDLVGNIKKAIIRESSNGRTSAFEADDLGSNPSTRSQIKTQWFDPPIELELARKMRKMETTLRRKFAALDPADV